MLSFDRDFPTVLTAIAILSIVTASFAQSVRVLPRGQLPNDKRLERLVDLHKDYFGLQPPTTPELWAVRAERLRRQTLLACGLWPMPSQTPTRAVVHGKVDRGDYTVEKVYLESFPNHFVTGNLYRPKNYQGKRPGILTPHGHWEGGRFYDRGPEVVRKDIIQGRERFEPSGRYPTQARCVQLARMGCIVFHYDMVGYADCVQVDHHAGIRDEMNSPQGWGYFSPQAELRLQSILGLQTYNSVRALDWFSSLAEVDPKRIGVTGASGGGTQTFLLAAIDPRPAVVFPAVMVSSGMQGGCSCENACYLRIGTGNVELAALAAPRPLGMTGANDWTREIMTKGFPELRATYKVLGVEDLVMAKAFLRFPHNYNYVSRGVMYHWFNRHLELGFEEPIVEEDFLPLLQEEMTVWSDLHPKPIGGEHYERSLLKWISEESDNAMAALVPADKESFAEYRKLLGGAWDVIVGRSLPKPGSVKAIQRSDTELDDWMLSTFLLRNEVHEEEVPAILLTPKNWTRRVAIWVDKRGKEGLFIAQRAPRPSIQQLLSAGTAVLGIDLFGQGEFTQDGQPLTKQRLQPMSAGPWKKKASYPWGRYAGFTFGYNYSLFSKRVHDVLSAIAYASEMDSQQTQVDLVGLRGAGHWVAAARAQAGLAVSRAAIDTGGFRFASVTSFDDTEFVPGAVKYLDVPGLSSLSAPGKLWLADGKNVHNETSVIRQAYKAASADYQLTIADVNGKEREWAALRWLLSSTPER